MNGLRGTAGRSTSADLTMVWDRVEQLVAMAPTVQSL